MNIASLAFFLVVIATAACFHAISSPLARRVILAGVSIAFLLSFGTSWVSLWPVLLFGLLTVCSIRLVAARPKAMPAAIAALVVLFLCLKGYLPGIEIDHTASTIGISYILFRAIQLQYDLAEETIAPQDLDFLDVFLFLFSFLTLTAGPIQRFDEFKMQMRTVEAVRPAQIDPSHILPRIVAGFIKLIVIAPAVERAFNALIIIEWPPSIRLGLAASVFMFWIYVNFTGYMDIVISLGRLFGFSLPENFNRPDRAINFLDIWNRWHITLSRTMLTYIFNPFVRMMQQRTGFKSPVVSGIAGFFVVFFLIGYWHGAGSQYALSGLLLGTAAAITKIWQLLRARIYPFADRVFGGGLLSGAMGLGSCAIGLVPTWPIFRSANEVFGAFGSPALFLQALTVASAVGLFVRLLGVFCDWIAARTSAGIRLTHLLHHPALVGLALVALFAYQIDNAGNFSPFVYYQRF